MLYCIFIFLIRIFDSTCTGYADIVYGWENIHNNNNNMYNYCLSVKTDQRYN